ncbi:MAG: hypothetical protein AAF585_22595 [Verrucomicrobiota bacterium]
MPEWSALVQDPSWVAALAACATALLVFLIMLIVAAQLGGIKKQLQAGVKHSRENAEAQRRRATVEAVRRYETDPQLRGAIQAIWAKTKQGTDYTTLQEADEFHVITVLNYFDGIASGIQQGVLVEDIAKDQLNYVLDKAVKALIKGQSGDTWIAEQSLVTEDNYETLLQLQNRWELQENTTYEMLR